MANYANLLSFSFLNKLDFFSKFIKNGITLIVSNTFKFKVNNIISKNAI